MRVAERGGTTLGSMLSNKNLWTGTECGRKECKTCCQKGEKREDCIRRNILYESECERCVTWKVSDKEMKRTGGVPSLYVGESARSLFERSTEHWQAAHMKKEESHMHQHMVEEHRKEIDRPEFRFRVVRAFKTALDRQIAEAIRIEMRGQVLNRRGEFNRCSLTRLGLDYEWEEERWRKSIEMVQREENEKEEVLCIEESAKVRRIEKEQPAKFNKRRKLDMDGKVWGEYVGEEQSQVDRFLKGSVENVPAKGRQGKLNVMTGLDWQAYRVVLEMIANAVDRAWDMGNMDEWEEWEMMTGHPDSDVVICGETGVRVVEGKNHPPPPKPKRVKKSRIPVDRKQKPVTDFFMSAEQEKKVATNPTELSHTEQSAAEGYEGGNRPVNDNVIYKSRSGADVRREELFSKGMGGGSDNIRGVNTIKQVKDYQIIQNVQCCKKRNEIWFQKLQKFRAAESDVVPHKYLTKTESGRETNP